MYLFTGSICPAVRTDMITRFKSKAGKCLILSTNRTTWFEAIEFCRSLNANLATINTMDTLKTVVSSAKSHGQYWTGLHRITWDERDNRSTNKNRGRFLC